MGFKYTIFGWTWTEERDWHDKTLYEGHSLFHALFVMLKSLRHYNYVRAELRP